jgi:hypothetical protein
MTNAHRLRRIARFVTDVERKGFFDPRLRPLGPVFTAATGATTVADLDDVDGTASSTAAMNVLAAIRANASASASGAGCTPAGCERYIDWRLVKSAAALDTTLDSPGDDANPDSPPPGNPEPGEGQAASEGRYYPWVLGLPWLVQRSAAGTADAPLAARVLRRICRLQLADYAFFRLELPAPCVSPPLDAAEAGAGAAEAEAPKTAPLESEPPAALAIQMSGGDNGGEPFELVEPPAAGGEESLRRFRAFLKTLPPALAEPMRLPRSSHPQVKQRRQQQRQQQQQVLPLAPQHRC